MSRSLTAHLRALSACEKCPAMHKPVVLGRPVMSRILLVGQAPGDKEPLLGRPFAWTAGKTLFRWFEAAFGWDEETVRSRIRRERPPGTGRSRGRPYWRRRLRNSPGIRR